MNKIYLSAIYKDGLSPNRRYLICSGDDHPLLFDTEENASKFWKEYKDRFDVPENFIGKYDFVVRAQTFAGDFTYDLENLLENGERKSIKPRPEFMIQSDDENVAKWLN